MEENNIFTKEQQAILSEVKNNQYLSERFYFTGGTALAGYYLGHRYSDDLDFFTEAELETEILFQIVEQWRSKYSFTITTRLVEGLTYRFNLLYPDKTALILDFSKYQKRIEKSNRKDGIAVDSLRDIATNKLLTIQQRTDVKDFVDLMFLLKQFDVWSLSYSMEKKFGVQFEPYLYAADFLKVEDFTILPRMIKPVQLLELQDFYRNLSLRFGSGVMEE